METLTFLFTDIEGSTVLLRRVGDGVYAQMLADHHSIIRSALAAHGGSEVDTQGDAFFAVFSSPRACVAAVTHMQQALEEYAWPAGEHVRVRMGVHTGEAATTATGLVGVDVHRAARVAGLAYGGQVLLSETAAALVRDSLPPGAALRDLGVHRLKDLGRPEQIFQLGMAGLRAEFPPLRSLGNPALQNNLPAQRGTFIGRDRELSEVRALVESCPLVTLTGAGGAGKTRLSLQVAAELLDGSGDGVWLVELAALSGEDDVASAICEALGIAWEPGRPALETLLDALAPQDVLIVLDNCEHLISACAKTADAILRRCPRVHLVATSREPLGIGGESIYRVPSLSLPGSGDGPLAAASSDAIALLVERAKEQGTDLSLDGQNGPLAVAICTRLDGMPLAIELAAARLRSLSLRALHDRLDQRFRLLTGGSRTALARQQTLRATVDWSYSLLNGTEQVLLRRLSVFPESFDLDAAEGVCGFGDMSAFEVIDLLGSLVDKSLVVAEPAGGALRYRLLETIRQFAAERLTEAGDDEAAAVVAAHCQHFLAAAEAATPHLTGPEQGSWFARLDADQASLRRAAGHAASYPDGTARVLRFGVALRRYWMVRARNEEALRLFIPVLGRPDVRAVPSELFGKALITGATLAQFHDVAMARRLGEQAVAFARQCADEALLIDSLALLGCFYSFAGEPDPGIPLAEEAVQRARGLGDDVLLGWSLMAYLLLSDQTGLAGYGELFAEAVACTQRSGDQFIAGLLHNNAGAHALRAGDITAARAHLERAARAMHETGADSQFVSVNLGWVLRQEGDPHGARAIFEAGLRLSRHSGERAALAYTGLGLACVTADLADWSRAAELHGIAQALVERTGEPWQEPEADYRLDSLGMVRTSLGEEQFERVYASGMALSLDQAIDLALETARNA